MKGAFSSPRVLTGLVALGASSGIAAGEIERSDRQAVFAISSLGIQEDSYAFPVTYCPHDRDCRERSWPWRVSIDQDHADSVLAENMPWIIPPRYDQLILEGDETRIETATQEIASDADWIPTFTFSGDEDFDTFVGEVQDHLDSNVAEPLGEVLSAARQDRYEEMPRDEQTRFIEERAQEVGIPADVLEELVNSSYTFALYLPEIESGEFTINQRQRSRPDGSTYYEYETVLEAPLNTKLAVFEFDGESFDLYDTVDTEPDNFFEALAHRVSGTNSVTTESRPGRGDGQDVFDEVFAVSFGDTVTALTTRLKADSNFAVAAPAEHAEDGSVEVAVGNQEDIRPGAIVTASREIDGEQRELGWGIVREVGTTCLALDESERDHSSAQLITDEGVEEFDQIEEWPYTGTYGRIGLGLETTEIEFIDGSEDAGAPTYLDLGFQGNLAFLRNDESFNGVWANVDVGFGSASDGSYVSGGDRYDVDGEFSFRSRAGAEYRYHVANGVYVQAGADLGFEYQQYDAEYRWPGGFTRSDDLTVMAMHIQPRAGVGYYLSPEWKIQGSVGYTQPLWTDSDFDGRGTDPFDDMLGGANAMVSIARHIAFAGPFAEMSEPPVEDCQQLREAEGGGNGETASAAESFRSALACQQR